MDPVPAAPQTHTLLSTADLAERLQVDSKTVRNWRKDGLLPPAIQVGTVLRWDPVVIEDWLASRTEDAR